MARLMLLALLLGLSMDVNAQFFTEDFDDITGTPLTYTNGPCNDGATDYFGIVCQDGGSCGSTVGSAIQLAGGDGGAFLGAHDTNAEALCMSSSMVSVTLQDIDIIGQTIMTLCFEVAEDDDDANQDWDGNSNASIAVQIDDGGVQTLFDIEGVTTGSNSEPAFDCSSDGLGDGPAITSNFMTYCFDITGSGSLLDIIINIDNLNDGDEDIAFDNFQLFSLESGGVLPGSSPCALCGISSFGPATVTCQSNMFGINNDMILVEIPYIGVETDANVSIDISGSTGTNVGDDPAVITDGAISFLITEGDTYSVDIMDTDMSCNLIGVTGSTADDQCDPVCGIMLDPAFYTCVTNTHGDDNDGVTVNISYSGIDASITSLSTTSGGTIAGADLSSFADGIITMFGLNEGDPWDLTINGGICDGTTTSGMIPSSECDPAAGCPAQTTLNFQMINPCGNDGDNEFISFSTGADIVNIADLAFGVQNNTTDATWNFFWGGSNVAATDYACLMITSAVNDYPLLEPGTDDVAIAALVAELNAQAGCMPTLFTAAPAAIPPNSDVVVFLGAGDPDGFDDVMSNLDFSNNCGQSYYAVFGAGTSNTGYFSNTNSRLSTLDFGGGCDCVTQFSYTPGTGVPGYVFNGSAYQTSGPCVPPNVLLPVEWIDFSAVKENGRAKLYWATAQELNNDYFEVQWSLDGIRFETLAELLGAGTTSSVSAYQYYHDEPQNRVNYYRLKQVDYDGRFEYSRIKSVLFTEKKYAIPFVKVIHDQLFIDFDDAEVKTGYIFDSSGRMLGNYQVTSDDPIDIGHLSQGIYFLIVSEGDKSEIIRWIKF